MFDAFDGIEKIIAILFSLSIMFALTFFIYVLSTKTPYDNIIKSCESIGYFYINENMSVKCEVIKR
jgi:hypothetical protein